MPRSPAEIHDRVGLRIREITTAAMRADPEVIEAVLASAPDGVRQDGTDFLRRARRLLLAVAISLDAALQAHRRVIGPQRVEVCRSCGTRETCPTVRRIADTLAAYLPGPVAIDRSEAWRRADAGLDATRHGLLVGIDEIRDGFVAWTAPGRYPARAHPAADNAGVLIVDRRTGRITRWPALPLDQLDEHYGRYLGAGRPAEHC